MTGLASLGGHWMSCRFIGGIGAGMTGRAGRGGLRMIKRRNERQPGGKSVAGFANIRG